MVCLSLSSPVLANADHVEDIDDAVTVYVFCCPARVSCLSPVLTYEDHVKDIDLAVIVDIGCVGTCIYGDFTIDNGYATDGS